MSIVKNTPHYLKHSQLSFTTVLNNTLESIEDCAAMGIYIYLASKPNQEISVENLMNRFKKDRDFIDRCLNHLEKTGVNLSTTTPSCSKEG